MKALVKLAAYFLPVLVVVQIVTVFALSLFQGVTGISPVADLLQVNGVLIVSSLLCGVTSGLLWEHSFHKSWDPNYPEKS